MELITGHPAGWNDDDAEGKTAYYFQITGSRTEEGAVDGYNNQKTMTATSNRKGTVTNERTKGRVTVLKYDTESEIGKPQGDAVLDGAVMNSGRQQTSFMRMDIRGFSIGRETWSEPERWARFRADSSSTI